MEESVSKSSETPSLQRSDTIPSSQVETTSQIIQPAIQKIGSVLRDAEKIAALLDIKNFETIYDRVKALRTQKDRTGIVINEILEGGVNSLQNHENGAASDKDKDLLSDLEVVKLAVKDLYPYYDMNLDEVYSLLETHSAKPNRAAIVKDMVIQKISENSSKDDVNSTDVFRFLNTENEVFNDMETLISKYPQVEPHRIFQLMVTRFLNSADRVNDVSRFLDAPENLDNSTNSKILQTDLITDSLLKDTENLAALFPDKDKNEIYAYLEAHVRDSDRVQLVTNELLKVNTEHLKNTRVPQGNMVTALKPQVSQGTKRPKDSSKHVKKMKIKRLKSQASVRSKKHIDLPYPELQREKEVELLHAVFPDCDPNFLFEKLEAMTDDPERVNRLSHEMFENADYPKLKDRLKREQRQRRLQQLLNQKLDLKDFLLMFPQPESVFEDSTRNVGGNYKKHVLAQLKNDFPLLKEEFIQERIEENHNLYFFSHRALTRENDVTDNPNKSSVRLSQPRENEDFPEILDEFFFKELLYVKHADDIKDFIKNRDMELEEKLETAIKDGEAVECPICCVDVLPDDINRCDDDEEEDDPHHVCGQCIQDMMKEYMNQGRVAFICMHDSCVGKYPLNVIKKYIPSSSFSVLLRRVQEDEIRQADIKDLVSCPFCSFATIMSDPDDKVLKCLNPDCLIESCRLCQEPNHVPLRCDEIIKQGASDMKSYIELKMTEAMIRTCWRCKKRYFKTEGCNRMTCSCGASMCYLCKRPVNSYDHFGNEVDGKVECPLQSDAMDQNREDMEQAALKAKEEWLKDHPEDANVDYDPLEMIRKKVVRRKKAKAVGAEDGEEDEYEEVEVNPLTEYYDEHGLLDEDIDEIEFDDNYIDEGEYDAAVQNFMGM